MGGPSPLGYDAKRPGASGSRPFSRGHLYRILSNPIYTGKIAHKDAVFAGQHPAIVNAELWQSVQERLDANLRGHRTRATAINPSLLTNLVFDDQGQRLTPTHAKKGARRYRYYVGQLLHAAGRGAAPGALRWPAQELESVVLQSLARFLADESRLMELMGTASAGEVQSRINTDALWASVATADGEQQTTLIEVPAQLKRSGLAVRLIVRTPGVAEHRKVDPKLVALIAKAQDWFGRIASGRSDSLLDISREEKVTSAYVARVVNLAFLAPDIVQRIVRGDYQVDLNQIA